MIHLKRTVCLLLCLGCCFFIAVGQNGDQKASGELLPGLSAISNRESFPELRPSDTNMLIRQINASLGLLASNTDSAHRLLIETLKKSLYLHYDCGVATSLANLGAVHSDMGQYEKAMRYYHLAEPYAHKGYHNRTSLAMFYSCMSAPYYYLSNYDSMFYYCNKALQLIDTLKPRTWGEAMDISGIYNNTGMLWEQAGKAAKAEPYMKKAVAVLKNYEQQPIMQPVLSKAYANYALICADLERRDSAVYYYERALQYSATNTGALISLAKIKSEQGQRQEAIKLLQKAITINQTAQNYTNLINAKAILGKIYYDVGQKDKAEQLLTASIALSKGKGEIDLYNAYYAYHHLSSIKAEQGKYKQAFELEHRSTDLLDSIKTKEKLQSLYDIEYEIRTLEKDKQIARKQLQINTARTQLREKNILSIALGAGFLMAVLVLFSLYRNSRNKQKLQKKELYTLQQQQEIGNLKSMIKGEEKERTRIARDLHDGIMVQLATVKMNLQHPPDDYKALSSQEYIRTDHYQGIIIQMEEAARELRKTAHHLMPDMLLQGGLGEALAYFCTSLQKNTALNIRFQQTDELPELPQDTALSLYRVIQELLQNVLKHAKATTALVQLARPDNHLLTITVEDNGTGFDPGTVNGMGLKSLRSRIQVLNGAMDISSAPGKGTSVYIELDILSSSAPQNKPV